MATPTLVPPVPPLLDATVEATDAVPVDENPHWHMPTDTCDHRTYACSGCCPHGDDAD